MSRRQRVVPRVPDFSVVHSPLQPGQSPFPRRGRQSCLQGTVRGGTAAALPWECSTAPLISTSVLPERPRPLQLHAPPPSPCCGSFGEGKPLAVPRPPGKLLAKMHPACRYLPRRCRLEEFVTRPQLARSSGADPHPPAAEPRPQPGRVCGRTPCSTRPASTAAAPWGVPCCMWV